MSSILDFTTGHLKKQAARRPKPVAGRILELRKPEESDSDFARRLGFSPQIVSNWRNGTNEASLEAVAQVLEEDRHANAHYLVTGKYRATEPTENDRLVQQMRELLGIRDGRGRKID